MSKSAEFKPQDTLIVAKPILPKTHFGKKPPQAIVMEKPFRKSAIFPKSEPMLDPVGINMAPLYAFANDISPKPASPQLQEPHYKNRVNEILSKASALTDLELEPISDLSKKVVR